MKIERHATVIRWGLVYLAVIIGLVAVAILIAPRDFYDNFPAGPSAWVSQLPPYNEHLERDFGSAGLGLAVLAALSAYWMDRRLVQAACISLFVGSLPHAIYHATTFDKFSTGDNIVSFGGLMLQALLPLGLLYLASGSRQDGPASASVKATPKEA